MINLFDTYNQNSWDLHYSLLKSGYQNPTIAINDDGFLPDDVTSPYLYFTGFESSEGRPLYFNEVVVPEYWEIGANNNQGEIFDLNQRRGVIHFAQPTHLRQVQSVDWFDLEGRRRLTDRYNKFGHRYAQTTYNIAGQATLTSYFTADNQEVLVENHMTGDTLLEHDHQTHLFKNKSEFVIYYLRVAGFNLDRIFYNSLSTPFLVTYRLGQVGQDVLFWQEGIANEIPGNMQLLLRGSGARQTKVVVQNRKTYDRMLELLPDEQRPKVDFLGFHYPFRRQNDSRPSALVLTNSDNLEGLSELVEGCPSIQFHIAALTEMSQRLNDFGKNDNVTLYPNVSQANVKRLFAECSVYLDINHGNEILSAIRTSFENRMPILAFDNTIHNHQYTAPGHIFVATNHQDMVAYINHLFNSSEAMLTALAAQYQVAEVETKENYQAVLG